MRRKKKKQITKSSEKNHAKKTHSIDKDGLMNKLLKPEMFLIGVFILALSIRLLYLKQIISTPIFHGLAVDVDKCESFAFQILNGNYTHKDFIYLSPFYPFFLTLVYLVCGQNHFPVVLIQGIIDSISCIVIYYIALKLFNKKVGITAAFIYACYGIAIFYTGILLAPTMVIFFTLLFIASLLVAEDKKQVTIFFISGVLFGLVVLARPNIILFLFFLPLWFFNVLKDKLGINKVIQGFLLLLVGLIMVNSLIIMRNYSIEGRFSPFSVQGGINFYIGNNPKAIGKFMSPQGISMSPIDQIKTAIDYAEKESGKRLTPSQSSLYWFFRGLRFIKDNPLDAFFLYMKKFALFWRKEELSLNIDYSLSKSFAPIFRFPFISFGIMVPFAIIGIILSFRRKNNILLNLFIVSYMISVIIFFVSARYRLPIIPFLIICSAFTLYRLVEVIQSKEIRELTIFGFILILFLFVINKDFKNSTATLSTVHYNNLGKTYSEMGKLDRALIELKKALSINPYYEGAHFNLGNVYLKKGLITEAIDEYKKALEINPNNAKTHTILGNAYTKKRMLDEAISEHKKALAIDPTYAKAHTNLGITYYMKRMLDEAILEYKKALEINPNLIEAHNNLGLVYYYKKNYKLAIEHCDKVVKLRGYANPKLVELLKPYR